MVSCLKKTWRSLIELEFSIVCVMLMIWQTKYLINDSLSVLLVLLFELANFPIGKVNFGQPDEEVDVEGLVVGPGNVIELLFDLVFYIVDLIHLEYILRDRLQIDRGTVEDQDEMEMGYQCSGMGVLILFIQFH